jgi:hypothetical protein
MDPGLLTLGALAVGASALLSRFQKSKKEGFDVIPSNNYPSSAAQAQAMYNEFTLASDPRTESNRVAQMTPQQQQNYQAAVNSALTGIAVQTNPNGTPSVAPGQNTTPVYIPDQNALLQKIAYCESKQIDDNVFNDPRFAESCGVCLTKGTLNSQQPFTGKKGLYVSENDRQAMLNDKSQKGLKFNQGKPTMGYCEGATQGAGNQLTFALDKTELLAYQKRMKCQHEKSLTGECATCLADGSYTYLGRQDQLAYDFIKFYVAGQGTLEVSIAGQKVDLAPPIGTVRTYKMNLSSTPTMFPATVKEGDIMVFTVSTENEVVPGELYGCLEAPTSTGGVFQVSLDKLLVTDETKNSVPRKSRDFPVLQTPNGQVYCVKLLTQYGSKSMTLTGTLPFLFAGNTEFQGVDCNGSILQSKPSSVERYGGDPCYKPATQKEGTWTDACLKDRIQQFGCTADGDLFKNPGELRTMPMPDIIKYVQNAASKQYSDNASSKKCNGKNISTPCDPFISYSVNDSPTMTKECVRFLYYNQGADKPGIGPTYNGPVNSFYSLDERGNKMYCLPGAGYDVDTNPNMLGTYERIARNGYKGQLGLKGIQTFMNDAYRTATNTGLNANLGDGQGGRFNSIGYCFRNLAQVPDNVLPAQNLPNAQYLKISYPAGRIDCIQISQIAAFDNRDQNVAFGKPVTAANKLANDCGPERAVDGKLQSRWHPYEYHSQCKAGDFWMVDFTREYPIKKIDYYNRADCCSTRANGMILELLNKNKQTVWQTTLRGGLPVESFFTFARDYNI